MGFGYTLLNNILLVAVISLIIIGGLFIVIYNPYFADVPHFKFPVFIVIAITETVLKLLIGLFLIYRWKASGRKNKPFLIFGIAYLLIIITAFGHLFHGMGVINRNNPHTFFYFYQFFIWWTTGILYGTLFFYTDNPRIQIIPPLTIFVLAYIWSLILFIGYNNIKLGMNGLTYFFLVPTQILIAYAFYQYSLVHKGIYGKAIFVSSAIQILVFLNWAPSFSTNLWFIVIFTFIACLGISLFGFAGLACEK